MEKEGLYPFAVPEDSMLPHLAFRPLNSSAPSLHRPQDALGLDSPLPVPGARIRIPLRKIKKSTVKNTVLFCWRRRRDSSQASLTTLSFLVSRGKATLTTNALLPLLIAPFICRGQRSQTSPTHLRCSDSKPHLNFTNKKRKYPRCGYLRFCWRRRRDSNPRTGFPTYALSRGASSTCLSTSPNAVKLKKRTMSLHIIKMAERVGFEPTRPCGQTVFKTASL